MEHLGPCRAGVGAPLTLLLCVSLPQCDPGNTGFISTGKFRSLLDSHSSKLDPHKREVLLALADSHANGQICYQDFVNLVSTLGPSPLGVACLGVWIRGPFCIINDWDWWVSGIEKLQTSADERKSPRTGFLFISGFCFPWHQHHSKDPLAIPDLTMIAAKWLQPFQPSHPQTSPRRRAEELFLWELPHEAWDFLPHIGLDWVSGMC